VLGPAIAGILHLQSGVIARFQAREDGLSDADIRRLVRGREWARVHPGVYVDHTGPLTWRQRAWAGVLVAWPAALCHASAIRAVWDPHAMELNPDLPIHVGVDRQRAVRTPPGVVAHRLADFETKVLTHTSPPRVRLEQAALDVAAEARDDLAAVAGLADLVQARHTTAERLQAALETRSRIARRTLISSVLSDVASGSCSLLEHDFLNLVERAHGLPRAQRQVRASARGPVFRDVVYKAFGLIVELDGRLFHDNARSRDRDLDRDLDAVLESLLTVRLGWGQAHLRPCETAARLGRLLRHRGWSGSLHPCPSCCPAPR
jgi:hypothetical protein